METPAVLHLPPFPNVTRAHCPAAESQEVEPYSYSFPEYDFIPMELLMQFMPPQLWGYWSLQQPPPMGFWNYFMGWYWEFSNNLQWFFPYMFFDIRYGNVIHRTANPDDGELTYDSTGLDISIDGTKSAIAWGATYTFDGQTKDGHLTKMVFENDVSWADCWTELLADTPSVDTSSNNLRLRFYWRYRAPGPGEPPYPSEYWEGYKERGYVSFDTSSLSGKTLVSAKLRLYCSAKYTLDEYEIATALNIYQQAWDTLDVDDWAGGVLVNTVAFDDITQSEYFEVSINTDYINKTGETQFKIAWDSDMDGSEPDDPSIYNPDPGEAVNVGGHYIEIRSANYTEKPQLVVVAG